MILVKDGQTKILDDGSKLIGVLKAQGWKKADATTKEEVIEAAPEAVYEAKGSWLGKIKHTITGD